MAIWRPWILPSKATGRQRDGAADGFEAASERTQLRQLLVNNLDLCDAVLQFVSNLAKFFDSTDILNKDSLLQTTTEEVNK